MSKYKAGDKVVIRKDLIIGGFYGDIYWGYTIDYMKGKEYVVIERIDKYGDYCIEDGWSITDEMIECLYK